MTASQKTFSGRPLVSLLRYNRPYFLEYLGGALFSLFYIGAELCIPLVIRAVVSRFDAGGMAYSLLGTYLCLLLGVAIASGFARYAQRMLMIRASRKFEYDLRNDYFLHVQRLSQDFYHEVKTGDIMARATNDLNFVRSFIGPGLMGSVDMIRVPFTLGMMFYLSTRLAGVALIPLPFVSLLVYFFVMYMHRQSKKVQEQFSTVTSRAQENLAGARVVKAYGVADREVRDFRRESKIYMRESLKLDLVMSLAWPLIGLVMGLTMLLVLWYGGGMVIEGQLEVGDFAGFVVYLLMMTWPLAQFGWIMTLYQRGAVSMKRIAEIMTREPTIQDGPGTRWDIERVMGGVEFRDVSFSHGGAEVLSRVSFRLGAGETVAIVGPTGSGKSTVVSLLTREYDPACGCVLFDGVDAREIPLRVVRGGIGYVPQDTFLFSASVGENLTIGNSDACVEAMDRACEVAQFSDTLAEMSGGYDTLLGERGVNLSGGQKQRLAIARAVIRDPVILILDDALSSVDTHTEEEILNRLREVMRNRSSIIISHRVSTVRHADQILVLDEGRVVERGRHEELVAAAGIYADMYERQRLEDELEQEA